MTNVPPFKLSLYCKALGLVVTSTLAASIFAAVNEPNWPPNSEGENQYILRYDTINHPVRSNTGMVVSQNEIATQVGLAVLKNGGNAVDAAVAVGFTLAVTLPRAGNLGGGGFMLLHNEALGSEHVQAIDYRGKAPSHVSAAVFIKENGKVDRTLTKTGHSASTVPGTVAGLYAAHQKFGSQPWEALIQPAIKLARNGFTVSSDLAWALKAKRRVLAKNSASCRIFFNNCSGYLQAGDTLKQEALAATMETIAKQGRDGFYRGRIAAAIAKDMQANGGFITAADLANYDALFVPAISTNYRGHKIVSMPPPAGGLPLLQTMNILEQFDIKGLGLGSAANVHILAEAMKRAYAYRYRYLGDPRFNKIPVAQILDKKLAKKLAATIDLRRATNMQDIDSSLSLGPPPSPNTTHYSIIDSKGNAVSNTYTLSASFGSGVTIAGTGVLMNNQINNFVIKPDSFYKNKSREPNAMAPGKRTKSTQSPTFVFKDGKILLATGTPGGRRIITTIAQLLSNVIDHNLNIADATQASRIHQGFGKRDKYLEYEPGFSPDTLALLKAKGHLLKKGATMGSTQSIMRIDGKLYGAADTRRPNAKALGYDQ